jgi:hypothetical protein
VLSRPVWVPPIASAVPSLLSSALRAAINAMLHVSTVVKTGEIVPGNIYFFIRESQNRNETRTIITDKEWQETTDDTFFGYEVKLPANHFALLMEISPICDFAQSKSKLPRFIGGYLVPEDGVGLVRDNAYVKTLGPLRIEMSGSPKLSGVYYLALNTHYIISIQKTVAKKLNPTIRIRTPVLNDLISWSSNHSARLGILHVGP